MIIKSLIVFAISLITCCTFVVLAGYFEDNKPDWLMMVSYTVAWLAGAMAFVSGLTLLVALMFAWLDWINKINQ